MTDNEVPWHTQVFLGASPSRTIAEAAVFADADHEPGRLVAVINFQNPVVISKQRCKAQTGNVGANDPQECIWPHCGCFASRRRFRPIGRNWARRYWKSLMR